MAKRVIRESLSLYEAKTHLSALVDRVSSGEEVIIMKSGRPMAMLVPMPDVAHPRVSGQGRGLWKVGDVAIIDGVHARWSALLGSRPTADFARAFVHPEHGERTLDWMVDMYGWHCRHHTAHVKLGLQRARAGA